jgi:hypothetical protein
MFQRILVLLATERENPATTLVINTYDCVFVTPGAIQPFQHRFYHEISDLPLPKNLPGMLQNKFVHVFG